MIQRSKLIAGLNSVALTNARGFNHARFGAGHHAPLNWLGKTTRHSTGVRPLRECQRREQSQQRDCSKRFHHDKFGRLCRNSFELTGETLT